jgi:hypothetical protein
LEHVEFAAMVEAMAMKNGLKLAVNLGCNLLQADSDALD